MKKDIAPQRRSRKNTVVAAMLAAVIVMAFVCLFVGSSNMSLGDAFAALAKKGSSANNRIIWNIRIPRVLAAVIAGAGLSASGLVMQTNLNNPMASPSTLGVSNAAVFGANLSIIAFSGGFLSTGSNVANFAVGANPYATSLRAFSRGSRSARCGRRRRRYSGFTRPTSACPLRSSGTSATSAARPTGRMR